MQWQNTGNIESKRYRCGHCGNQVATKSGYYADSPGHKIYICPHCEKPTYFQSGVGIPGLPFGNPVAHLPADIEALYQEARNCVSFGAYTGSVLLCRKLLMNVAVSIGAAPGDPFIKYVEHLSANGYVPPNGKGWVDHIRKKGNEATHEISCMKAEDAEELLSFIEMLFKFMYEFPQKIPPAT